MKVRRYSTALATALCTVALLVTPTCNQAQQSPQILSNHLRPDVASGQAKLLSALPANQRMKLAIVLPHSNQAGLDDLLGRLYDPTSSDYRHFLSVSEFTDNFGPTTSDYQAVVDFAKKNGFTITDTPANRQLVSIEGTVTQVESAFHVKMGNYQHPYEARSFFSPDREPSMELSIPVAHIAGMDNFSTPHSHLKKFAIPQAMISPLTPTGSGPYGTFLAGDMRAAYYGGTSLTGTGQCVGLVEFDGYNTSDVTSSFDSVSYNVPINNVLIDGASASSDGSDGEQVLDIVQVIGMAPGLSQVRVYIAPMNNDGAADTNLLNKMASENLCKSLSASWTWGTDSSSDDPIFQEFAAQGQSYFNATGDAGALTGNANVDYAYPADSQYVTAVGGTSFTTKSAGGAWASETTWNDGYDATYCTNSYNSDISCGASGGGPSPDGISIPSWQVGVASSAANASTTLRNEPDVAAQADENNFTCGDGSCGEGSGGTSFATPRWAGFIALVNQQAVAAGKSTVGFLNPAIYAIGTSSSYTKDLHDITSGDNDNGLGQSFNAVTGYDLATGWGSPNGQALIDALAGTSNTCTPTAITPYIYVNSAWVQESSATVTSTSATVNLGPQPISGGSWSWSGPNSFTSTSREIDGIKLSAGTNTYTATYTNASGCKSTQAFTITVATPTAITPYMQVNGGAWTVESSATVTSTSATVNLGPQPITGGTWSWTGPNSFTSTSREIDNIKLSAGTNTYTATYTNSYNMQSTQAFTITVTPTNTAAVLTTPTPSSTLTSSSATFSWSTGTGVSNYKLTLGATAGGSDVYNSYTTTANSKTVSGIPTNGGTLYATLWSQIGGVWSSNAYTYTEASVSGKAVLSTPTPGSALTGSSATFTWSKGTNVTAYKLTLGTTAGGSDVYNSYTTTANSKGVSGIPTNGKTLYATLYSEISGVWSSNSYTYTEK